jgi:hypothetical protein
VIHQRLLALCYIKNELNRRRRRFYYYINDCGRGAKKKHISKKDASIGYRKTQREMKAMTAEMRALCSESGAHLNWNDCWGITSVVWSSHHVSAKDFKKWYEMEMFEETMFSETE